MKLRISRRLVSPKRHTMGYVMNGRVYSVEQATRLARNGQVAGVRVVGNHIQADTGRRRLTDLPIQIEYD